MTVQMLITLVCYVVGLELVFTCMRDEFYDLWSLLIRIVMYAPLLLLVLQELL